MNRFLLALTVFCLPTLLMAAKGPTGLLRGGLGLLVPDRNGFQNPGQFAMAKGISFETSYVRAGTLQTLMPSLVISNNRVGFGVYASRTSTDLMAIQGGDIIGGGFGFSLAKNRVTIGLLYQRYLSSAPNEGDTLATLTFNPNGKGFRLGGSIAGQIETGLSGFTARLARVGMGYSFSSMAHVEAVGAMDMADFTDKRISGYLNLTGRMVYLGAGYTFLVTSAIHQAEGRLGFVLANLDLSGYARQAFLSGSSFVYGGTLRLSF